MHSHFKHILWYPSPPTARVIRVAVEVLGDAARDDLVGAEPGDREPPGVAVQVAFVKSKL